MTWAWRLSEGGWITDGLFHAYNATNHMACQPGYGLAASARPPGEGDTFCPACIDIVKAPPDEQLAVEPGDFHHPNSHTART